MTTADNWDQTYADLGYVRCRPCSAVDGTEVHHRSGQCDINQAGQPLAPCGCPWDDLDKITNWAAHDAMHRMDGFGG